MYDLNNPSRREPETGKKTRTVKHDKYILFNYVSEAEKRSSRTTGRRVYVEKLFPATFSQEIVGSGTNYYARKAG